MATKKSETAIAVPQSQYPVLDPKKSSDIAEMIQANFGVEGVKISDLTKVVVPAGGQQFFSVAALEGVKPEAVVEGIIVLSMSTNAYWAVSLEDSSSQAPSCRSVDKKQGFGDPFMTGTADHHSCLSCPHKEWGSSKKGAGKACRDMQSLFILQKDSFIPIVIQVPPTSLNAFKRYCVLLSSRGIPYYLAETSVSLATEDKPVVHSVLRFALKSVLEGADRESIRMYRAELEKFVSVRSFDMAPESDVPVKIDQEPGSRLPYDPFADEDHPPLPEDDDSKTDPLDA